MMPKPRKQKRPTLPLDWHFPSQTQTHKSTSVPGTAHQGLRFHAPPEASAPVSPPPLLLEAQPQWSTATPNL